MNRRREGPSTPYGHDNKRRKLQRVHVYPSNDQIGHATRGTGCVCGPRVEETSVDEVLTGYLIIHHSLDGREKKEGLA